MKAGCKTVPSLSKGEGGISFLNKKLLIFWHLIKYTWSEILNLIKIIHVPQSITMRVTPLAYCVPPYFGLAYCVPPCFGLAYCVPFNNNTTIFDNFIYIKKIKWLCCVIMYNHSCKRYIWCVCLLYFLFFYIPKSMFMLINAEMTPQKARA